MCNGCYQRVKFWSHKGSETCFLSSTHKLFFFLSSAGFSVCFVAGQIINPPSVSVLEDTTAVLPCPDTRADVTWSRHTIAGQQVTLVTIKNGREEKTDERFGSQADRSLVITNVKKTDEKMYVCNGKQIYLTVITDPSVAVPKDQPEGKATARNDGVSLRPDQSGTGAAGDTDPDLQSSDWWKVPVGVVIGSSLVVLVIVTLRFWSKKKAERKSSMNKTVTEVIYQEIEDDNVQLRREPDDQSLHYSTISASPNSSSPAHLYSSVNKQETKSRSRRECVYSLVQNSAPTANIS